MMSTYCELNDAADKTGIKSANGDIGVPDDSHYSCTLNTLNQVKNNYIFFNEVFIKRKNFFT